MHYFNIKITHLQCNCDEWGLEHWWTFLMENHTFKNKMILILHYRINLKLPYIKLNTIKQMT